MKKRTLLLVVSFILLASMALSACSQAAQATEAPIGDATEAPVDNAAEAVTEEAPTTTRMGGWVDEIDVSVVSTDSVITQLQAGAIDIYAAGLSSRDLPTIKEAELCYSTANGTYYDIQFNPAGPIFENGEFNPFSNRKIREAVNYMIDRDYIVQEAFSGGALPKFFAITTQFPDYADLADKARELETKYAYNLEKADEIITAEMEGMGAAKVDGKWQYEGQPVSLIFLIRSDGDGTRLVMGEYISAQFEKLGFTVDRQLKTGSEASPIWNGTDPKEGKWHMYTAGWGATVIDRDQSNIFQEMYLPTSAQAFAAFQQNVADPEFQELGDRLYNADYASAEERHEMMARALELSLQDSLQVFLVDSKEYIPYNCNLIATADLAAGVESAKIYPFTLRFKDQEGGTVKWATQDFLFSEPYNPIAGTNTTSDKGPIQATASEDVMFDPFTGYVWPLRLERAEITVQEDLPVTKTLDWVTLDTAAEITVPGDAWVDWDAASQTFITADTKYPEGLTALAKVVEYFPEDLYETVKWHDGSPFSVADVVMAQIMQFDRAKEESVVYDAQAVPVAETFLQTFKGFKIISEDPLVVEFYTDLYSLDAELITVQNTRVWPAYTNNNEESAWEFIAIANMAEAAGELAYSSEKAAEMEIEQTSYIGGPSLEILSKYLDQAISEQYIPYAPTLSQYMTAEEAVARYEALKAWYGEHGHFKIGTGPYYFDKAYLTEKSLVLKHFADYPDSAARWANYDAPKIADVILDGPGQVKIGEEAVYNVYVTFEDEPYPMSEMKNVKFLLYDGTGAVVYVGEAEAVVDGEYKVVLPADVTAKLEAGSNKLEIAVVPSVVCQPTFTSLDFVTTP